MFTVRNLGGAALFVFGTTYMWLMPMMATKGLQTTGAMWSSANGLSLIVIAGFTVATWGLFQRTTWWESAAVASAIVGFVALVPYWLAATHAGEVTPSFNVLIHALGNVAVLVLLLVPTLEQWVNGHVVAGH